jgi:hypothetical protein
MAYRKMPTAGEIAAMLELMVQAGGRNDRSDMNKARMMDSNPSPTEAISQGLTLNELLRIEAEG